MSISQILSTSSSGFGVNITIPKIYKNKSNNSRIHSSINTPIKSNNDSNIYKTPIKFISTPSPMKLKFINDINYTGSEYMISPSNLVLSLSSISKTNPSSPYNQSINDTVSLEQLIKDIDVNNKDNYYNNIKGYKISPFKFVYQSHSDLNEIIKISTPNKVIDNTIINDDSDSDTSDMDEYNSMELYSIQSSTSNFELQDQIVNSMAYKNRVNNTWRYRDGNNTISLDLNDHLSIGNGLNSINSKILSNTVTVMNNKKSNNNKSTKISIMNDVIIDTSNKNVLNTSLFDQFVDNNVLNNAKNETKNPTIIIDSLTDDREEDEDETEINFQSTMEVKHKMSRNEALKERRNKRNIITPIKSNNIPSLNEKEIIDNTNDKEIHENKQENNKNDEIEKDLLKLKNDMLTKSNEILERLKNQIEADKIILRNSIDKKINVKLSQYSNPNYNFIKYVRTDEGVEIHHSLSVNPPKDLKDNISQTIKFNNNNNNNNETDNNNFYLSVIFILIGILSTIGIKKSSLYFSNVYSLSIENYLKNAELNAINMMKLNNYNDAKKIVKKACILIRKEKGNDHIDFASFKHLLAKIEFELNNFDYAETLLEEVFEINIPYGDDIYKAILLEDMAKVYHKQGHYNDAIDTLMNSINIITKCCELQDINNNINQTIDVNEYKNNLIKEAYARIEKCDYSEPNKYISKNDDSSQPNSILELELLLSHCDEFTAHSTSFSFDDIGNDDLFDISFPSHSSIDIARIYSLMGMISNDMNNKTDSMKYLTISFNMCNDLLDVAYDDDNMIQIINTIKNKCDSLMNIFEKEDIINYDNDKEEFTIVKIIEEKEDIEDDYEVEIVENLTIETVNIMVTPDGKHDKDSNNISPDSIMSPLLW